MPGARRAQGCPASTFPATTSINLHRSCLASCPCGFNFRQPDNPVYTAQPGVVTSRRRSWDLVLRSFIPVGRVVAVSRTTPHMPLVSCRPRFIFVEELAVKFAYATPKGGDTVSHGQIHPATGFFPHRQSAPWRNIRIHHRSILPWT